MGFAHEDIVVDVIMTSGANIKEEDVSGYKSIQVMMRYLEISSYYSSMDGLLRAKFAYPGANFRYLVMPTGDIPSSVRPLAMSSDDIDKAFALGVKDA